MNFYKSWVEIIFFVLLITGFIFSLANPSPGFSYGIIFVMGLLCGRLLYLQKGNLLFPYIFVSMGFVIGYLIGTRYGSWLTMVVLFLAGTYASYALHEQGMFATPKIRDGYR